MRAADHGSAPINRTGICVRVRHLDASDHSAVPTEGEPASALWNGHHMVGNQHRFARKLLGHGGGGREREACPAGAG